MAGVTKITYYQSATHCRGETSRKLILPSLLVGCTDLLSSLEPLLAGDFPLPNMIIWTLLRATTFETLEAYLICELRGISSRDVEGGCSFLAASAELRPRAGRGSKSFPFPHVRSPSPAQLSMPARNMTPNESHALRTCTSSSSSCPRRQLLKGSF